MTAPAVVDAGARRTVFERYPQLATLRSIVPDDVVEREVGGRADEFERWLAAASERIPTARLVDVFPAELEAGSIRLERFLGHWGNVSVEEVCKIALVVRWLRPRRVLEIGTYNGMTTLQMALNAPPDATVYTLDLRPEQQAALPLSDLDALIAKHFRERFGTSTGSYFAGRDDVRIVQLWGDSATFDYGAAIDGPLDLVFIDAAHDYANKRVDSENALRLLAPGGVILWHNYADVTCPEVTRYLGDLAARIPIARLKNTSLAVHRARP